MHHIQNETVKSQILKMHFLMLLRSVLLPQNPYKKIKNKNQITHLTNNRECLYAFGIRLYCHTKGKNTNSCTVGDRLTARQMYFLLYFKASCFKMESNV